MFTYETMHLQWRTTLFAVRTVEEKMWQAGSYIKNKIILDRCGTLEM